ncbi:MAG TPA: HAD family hydrolase [Candidatus Bathyarchaeia archaeon]|nr:HAD family hydrolase [Candidatus Bathyarchaeia archaeon]
MATPDILALDFDGVLCDGMTEYFETSRRTSVRVWPGEPAPGDGLLPAFRRLRPVIMTGWEMPLLLRAIAQGRPEADIVRDWARVRDEQAGSGPTPREELLALLTRTLDEVRREWIAADRAGWIGHNAPYCALDDVRRLVGEPQRCVLVTTKEGEFARLILEEWRIKLADIQGKEAGTHKCDSLRALIDAYAKARGRRPRVWFVEDRFETLEHVTTHPDLEDVGLYLAAWGYNTPETRATARASKRVRLLELDQFRRGLGAWSD